MSEVRTGDLLGLCRSREHLHVLAASVGHPDHPSGGPPQGELPVPSEATDYLASDYNYYYHATATATATATASARGACQNQP